MQKYQSKLIWSFLWGRWEKDFVPINDLKDYVGEKQAFFMAWLIHYTSWLLFPLLGGVILLAIQVSNFRDGQCVKFADCFTTAGNSVFSIFLALWSTLLCESWKRKEAVIANNWLMRDQATVVFPRKGYKANLTFDSELKTKYKKDYNTDYGIGFWLGKPVSLFFALSVIGVAIGNRYLNNYVTKSAHNETPSVYMMQLPTIFYVGATLLLGGIYAKVAAFIAKRENHRDE